MNWYKAESMIKPNETDTTSSKKYNYIRKDIEEVETEDGAKYEYLECKIPKSAYGLYEELAQARADIDYLTMITE